MRGRMALWGLVALLLLGPAQGLASPGAGRGAADAARQAEAQPRHAVHGEAWPVYADAELGLSLQVPTGWAVWPKAIQEEESVMLSNRSGLTEDGLLPAIELYPIRDPMDKALVLGGILSPDTHRVLYEESDAQIQWVLPPESVTIGGESGLQYAVDHGDETLVYSLYFGKARQLVGLWYLDVDGTLDAAEMADLHRMAESVAVFDPAGPTPEGSYAAYTSERYGMTLVHGPEWALYMGDTPLSPEAGYQRGLQAYSALAEDDREDGTACVLVRFLEGDSQGRYAIANFEVVQAEDVPEDAEQALAEIQPGDIPSEDGQWSLQTAKLGPYTVFYSVTDIQGMGIYAGIVMDGGHVLVVQCMAQASLSEADIDALHEVIAGITFAAGTGGE